MKRFALISLVLAATACAGGSTSPTPAEAVLAKTWRLQTIERSGAASVVVTEPDRYTLRLEATGLASVRADCNRCGGGYSLVGPRLRVESMACTLVGCPPDSLDSAYLSVLGGETQVSSDGATLALTSSRGVLRYTP